MTEAPSRNAVPITLPVSIIRCGTSRILAVAGPAWPGTPEALARQLFGEISADGLGGEHYQLNKLVIVMPSTDWHRFEFLFLQFDRSDNSIIAGLECANLAAGAGWAAVANGLVVPDDTGAVYATNVGSGQRIRVCPVAEAGAGSTHSVAFLYPGGLIPAAYSGDDGRTVDLGLGVDVRYWVVGHGNLFVLANLHPSLLTPERAAMLSENARQFSEFSDDAWRVPKIIAYALKDEPWSFGTHEGAGGTPVKADATCVSGSELHTSLPGSGAMCLSAFLAGAHLGGDSARRGFINFELTHPLGVLSTRAWFDRVGADFLVTATEFLTDVRVLLQGSSPLIVTRQEVTR